MTQRYNARCKHEIGELVAQIDGRFATANGSPIRFVRRSIAQDELAAIYRDANVALATRSIQIARSTPASAA